MRTKSNLTQTEKTLIRCGKKWIGSNITSILGCVILTVILLTLPRTSYDDEEEEE